MKYEHQINWANTYNNKLDISTVKFASELSVVPYLFYFFFAPVATMSKFGSVYVVLILRKFKCN